MQIYFKLWFKFKLYLQNEAQSKYQKFSTEKWTETIKYNYTNFDPKLKRQFEKYALLGLSALDEHDYAKVNKYYIINIINIIIIIIIYNFFIYL